MNCFTKKLIAALLCFMLLISLATGCKSGDDVTSTESNGTDNSDVNSAEDNQDDPLLENSDLTESGLPVESVTSNGQTGTTNKPKPTSSTAVTTKPPASPKVDFKGKTILIKSVASGAFGVNVSGEYDLDNESETSKLIREWREKFEKTYNCKIKLEQVTANDTQNQMIVKMMGGDKFADIIYAQRVDFERIRLAGNFLTDLNTVPYLDLNYAGYNQGLNEMYNYKGKQLALSFSMESIAQNGFIVNNTLLKTLKTEDPYKLANEGKWTFEKFFALLKAATKDNGNGTWDLQDQYGIIWTDLINVAMFKSAGVDILTQDANGKMKYSMNTPKFRTVADQIVNNIAKTHVAIPADNLTLALRQFCAGKVLMLARPSMETGIILENADLELGWLPVPTEKGGKDYVNIADGWAACAMIPAANKEPEAVGLMMSEFSKLYQDFHKALRKEYTNNAFVSCPECWDLFGNALVNWNADFYFPEMGNEAPWIIMHKVSAGDMNYVTDLEGTEAEIQAWVDDVFNK